MDKRYKVVIGNFSGNFGSITKSNITQNFSFQNRYFELENKLLQYGISVEEINELKTALSYEPIMPSNNDLGPQVRSWLGRIAQKISSGARDIGVGVTAGLLESAIRQFYSLP